MQQTDLKTCFYKMIDGGVTKIIVSGAASKNGQYKKITAVPKQGGWQIECLTEKQAFHENITENDRLAERLCELTEGNFRQVNGFAPDSEHIVLISKKGACAYRKKQVAGNPVTSGLSAMSAPEITIHDGSFALHGAAPVELSHNRRKNYIITEGSDVPPLVDMGVFTKEGRVVKSMYDKFRQINRFLEIIDDEIGDGRFEKLNVIDFGCGKSYLTFVIYHYLTAIKGIRANIIGLDLKADVISKCNAAAEKYGYTGLRFEVGNVNGFHAPFDVDMVVTLHACDTATDYALFNAIQWNTKMIFSVPCCQHELNSQIRAAGLKILTRYGIVSERFSALATDAVRANLLEYCGYRTQLLEFIDMEGTPKNLLIRAIKKSGPVSDARRMEMLSEIDSLDREFGFRPTLERLLDENMKIFSEYPVR